MTREEMDFIGGMNMCDEISNEAYKKIMCHCEEQEPVLDKIRAEITNIPITDTDGRNNNWYREPQAIINDVLHIIDKYKAESEDKECR